MSRQPMYKRYPTIIAWLAIALVILPLAMEIKRVAAVTLDEAVDGQQRLCQVLGSQPEARATQTIGAPISVRMTCHGGLLDGATCDVFSGTDADSTSIVSQCSRLPGPGGHHVTPDGGIEDVTDADGDEPGNIGDVAVQPDSAEDPTRSEPVVITAQPYFSVEEIATVLIGRCHILGGVDAEFTRSEENPAAGSLDVTCTGGPLYDLRCTIAVKTLRCEVVGTCRRGDLRRGTDRREGGGERPDADPERTNRYAGPPTPTAPMDDDSGTDPTAPPTFTAPGNVGDNRAPSGGIAEDPAGGQPVTGGGDEMPPTPVPTSTVPIDDNTMTPDGAAEDPVTEEP